MIPSQLPLHIVSFGPRSFCETLQTALQRLDWQVESVCGNDWLAQSAAPTTKHIILAIGSDDYPRHQLLAHLQRQPIAPVLAAVADHGTYWDSELLGHCYEFLRWPCRLEELSQRLIRGCGEVVSASYGRERENQLLEEFANLNLIGQSPAFFELLSFIKTFSSCEAPVLIEGETGTGKEMVARAIHYLGERRDYPFIPTNCGAMPDHLLENELFGHERGAYTDAKEAQSGLVAQAHRGTLFLDEIEALSPKAQVALLRFLQHQEYKPLGGGTVQQSNVRIIAASNTDLQALIADGAFRQDLFFRLNVMPLSLPPLRERRGDIELLADYFLSQYSAQYQQPKKAFHPAVLTWIREHPWPGNVRELESFVHRALLLSDGPWVHFPAMPNHATSDWENSLTELPGKYEGDFRQAKARAIEQFEKQYLEQLMAACEGNITVAARRAGKERRALGKLLKKHRIDRGSYVKSD